MAVIFGFDCWPDFASQHGFCAASGAIANKVKIESVITRLRNFVRMRNGDVEKFIWLRPALKAANYIPIPDIPNFAVPHSFDIVFLLAAARIQPNPPHPEEEVR